jgi:hypothetical protein
MLGSSIVNIGTFQVYDIANNQLTGAASLGSVGLEWQPGGFPPTASVSSDCADDGQFWRE